MTALLLGVVLYGLAIMLLVRFVSINHRDEEGAEEHLLRGLRESRGVTPDSLGPEPVPTDTLD